MKKIIGLITAVLLSVQIGFPLKIEAGRKSGRSYKSYSTKSYYKSTKTKSYSGKNIGRSYKSYSPKNHYKPKNIPKYTGGKSGHSYKKHTTRGYYKSTGIPKKERSKSARDKFLRSRGYKKVPPGYEVDHIVPLHKGGADAPYNMQLLPKELHKQKTKREK